MATLSEHEILLGLLALALILVVGRGAAEVARRLGQPEVLGELIGGFLLGPSVLGAMLPHLHHELFLGEGVGQALSMLSWIGAVLLLLIAGLEADLDILREKVRPGSMAAAFAIIPSIVAGTLFGMGVLGRPAADGFFLGLVLSVTAVSVAAKILIERGTLRRGYAQVILAAGIASEVIIWPLISMVGSLQSGNPVAAGLRSALFAAFFFVLMMTAGRRFTFWAMRRMADMTQVVNGQLSLVLVLAFLSAGITQALGLHALLGAFVFGVLLGQAPRATVQLREKVQTLTVGLFAPVFFVLAGMRVDIYRLEDPLAAVTVLQLFVVASVVKVGLGALGARLGGLRGWEPALVGIGVNLKGGTDVIVAILGAELGLFSDTAYTLYAVVAILTVLVSPPLLNLLESRVPPSEEERQRLDREEARRRAYLTGIERVLVPVVPELLPTAAARLVETLSVAKQNQGETFDITELIPSGERAIVEKAPQVLERTEKRLTAASVHEKVELTAERTAARGPVEAVLEGAKTHQLLVIGAHAPEPRPLLSLGELQDRIIDGTDSDVLVAIQDGRPLPRRVRRILLPVNGQDYSLAAGDVAAYLAMVHQAELVLFTVVRSQLGPYQWRAREYRDLLEAGHRSLNELRFRIGCLGVRLTERVRVGGDAGQAILRELDDRSYQMVVLGAFDRSGDDRLSLGGTVQSVLTHARTPSVVLISHKQAGREDG